MHIDSKDTIAQVSILKVRKLLQHETENDWTTIIASQILQIGKEETINLIKELNRLGYVEKADFQFGEQYWKNTIRGNALAFASTALPISRKTADRLLTEFLRRVDEVNNDSYFLYNIVEELAWPQTEAIRHLKHRSRAISIHSIEDRIFERTIHKEIYLAKE